MVLTSKCVGNNLHLGLIPGQGDGHHVEAHRGPGEALGLEVIIRQPPQPALLGWDTASWGLPNRVLFRVLTSTTTTVLPCRAMRSISPKGVT